MSNACRSSHLFVVVVVAVLCPAYRIKKVSRSWPTSRSVFATGRVGRNQNRFVMATESFLGETEKLVKEFSEGDKIGEDHNSKVSLFCSTLELCASKLNM